MPTKGYGVTLARILPAWWLKLAVWISTARHFLVPDIPDIKDFRPVAKGERIFMKAMGEEEFQLQEESWTLLGLQS